MRTNLICAQHTDDAFFGSFPLSFNPVISSEIYKFSKKIEDTDIDSDD